MSNPHSLEAAFSDSLQADADCQVDHSGSQSDDLQSVADTVRVLPGLTLEHMASVRIVELTVQSCDVLSD